MHARSRRARHPAARPRPTRPTRTPEQLGLELIGQQCMSVWHDLLAICVHEGRRDVEPAVVAEHRITPVLEVGPRFAQQRQRLHHGAHRFSRSHVASEEAIRSKEAVSVHALQQRPHLFARELLACERPVTHVVAVLHRVQHICFHTEQLQGQSGCAVADAAMHDVALYGEYARWCAPLSRHRDCRRD